VKRIPLLKHAQRFCSSSPQHRACCCTCAWLSLSRAGVGNQSLRTQIVGIIFGHVWCSAAFGCSSHDSPPQTALPLAVPRPDPDKGGVANNRCRRDGVPTARGPRRDAAWHWAPAAPRRHARTWERSNQAFRGASVSRANCPDASVLVTS